ncbi:MAG: thioesterase family protein [Bacteroidota bacterium]
MFRPTYSDDLFKRWHPISVRFRDLDPLNHVNNAAFNTYFEEARIHFLADVADMANGFREGKSFVLVKATIEYLKQVTYPSELLVGMGISKLGNTSVEAVQALFHAENKELKAVAYTTGVWFDVQRQRPTRLPTIPDVEQYVIDLSKHG